jgi:ribosomal protein S12 methylthiotransferase
LKKLIASGSEPFIVGSSGVLRALLPGPFAGSGFCRPPTDFCHQRLKNIMKKLPAKKLFLQSLGCPKNLVDSETMLGLLQQAGYAACSEPEEADLLLINTCGFIRPAVEEAIEEILALAAIKKKDPGKRLVVTGCLVQRYGEELRRELPEVDLFIGTDGFQELGRHLAQVESGEAPLVRCETPSFLANSSHPRQPSTPAHRAYLKVTEGCSNRCAYCLIPAIRGPLRSRPQEDLLVEARRLEQRGGKELTLIAQDLTAYGLDSGGPQLHPLLLRLLAETEIPWLRLLYLHPARVDRELLTLVAGEPRILPYLEIPLQHINGRILRSMNRPYDRADVEKMLAAIRDILPGAALRTTFMVGFPGETEEDVAELEDFIRDSHFDHLGIFTYSNEEGCAAASLPGQLPEEVKKERRRRLMEVQAAVSLAKNEQRVGSVEEVLVEGVSSETDLLLEGRTWYQAPEIDGCVYINSGVCAPGEMAAVRITEAHPYDLVGEIVEEETAGS